MPVALRERPLPVVEIPPTPPALSTDLYRARIAAVCGRAREQRLDILVVWGDREHSANLAYLTGFDPRFEEAMLILDTAGQHAPRLLVGNECLGYAPDPAIGIEVEPVSYTHLTLPTKA